MKILITGGTGFIGRHLVEYWKESDHRITVLARHIDEALFDAQTGCLETDITVEEDVQAAIIFLQPDVVIHSAAMSKPNDCEGNKKICYQVNVTATQYITNACKAIGAKLIFLSTDFVFGNHGPYSEEDSYDPVNYYGESKVLAEELIKASMISYAIVRTVLVVGEKLPGGAGSFLQWVKDKLEKGNPIRLYTDQQRSITYVKDLCSGINAIILKEFEGVVHLCGNEVFTPYSLAQQVAGYFGYDQNLLQPVTRQQQPEPAVRPENAVLKNEKAKEVVGFLPASPATIMNAVFG